MFSIIRSSGPLVLLLILMINIISVIGASRQRGNKQRNILSQNMSPDARTVSFNCERGPGPEEGRALTMALSSSNMVWMRAQRVSSSQALSFRLGFLSVYEYVEQDGVEGFSSGDFVQSKVDLFPSSANYSIPFQFSKLNQQMGILNDANFYLYTLNSSSIAPNITLRIGLSDIRGWIGAPIGMFLSPSAWKWDFFLAGFPYKNASSRIALKFFLDSTETPIDAGVVPLELSDDLDSNSSDIQMNAPNKMNLSEYDRVDVGYFSWKKLVTVQKDSAGREVTVPVYISQIYNRSTDPFPEFNSTHSILNNESLGRNPAREQQSTFFYLSFDYEAPYTILYDPFVGIDESDDDVETAGALKSSLTNVFLSSIILVVFIAFF